MKYAIINIFVLITAVCLQIYLLTTNTFLPYDTLGNLSVLNISVFIFLSFLIVYTFWNLLIFGVLFLLRRKELETNILALVSLKISSILSTGLLTVFLLNYFDLLDWIWGLSILFIVFIASIIV